MICRSPTSLKRHNLLLTQAVSVVFNSAHSSREPARFSTHARGREKRMYVGISNWRRVDVVVMRQLLLYCCNSTREPLLELKFPVCIASSNTYQVAYSISHKFVLMVNISQMLNNPFRWYYGTVVGIMRQQFFYIHFS